MPKRTVRLLDVALHEGILYGEDVRKRLDDRLTHDFENDPADPSAYDPLKIVIDFEGVVDIGAQVLDQLRENIRRLYQQNWYKYLTFTNLRPESPVFQVLAVLLRDDDRSIVCEPESRMFCGLSDSDMTLRGGRYERANWRDMLVAVDYLYRLGDDPSANTTKTVSAITAQGGGRKARETLESLDNMGIIMVRRTGTGAMVWCHVAKYDPPELEDS